MSGPTIIWLRNDLRIADNPALDAAARRDTSSIAIYIREPGTPEMRALGAASQWWLHHSLKAIEQGLDSINIPLVLRTGDARDVLEQIIEETGADTVFWNRRYGGGEIAVDSGIMKRLGEAGIWVESFNAQMLNEPWAVMRGENAPYRMFTPFWKAARAAGTPPTPLTTPSILPACTDQIPSSETLKDWSMMPTNPNWASRFPDFWSPGESGAVARLSEFLDALIDGYADDRNRPDLHSTSRLSPHLRFGEISPRAIWHATQHRLESGQLNSVDAEKFLSEIGWREFAYSLLYFNPDLAERNIQARFDDFPWQQPDALFDAWCKGRTGFPIVDAGMRELWQTGWMHNRVRMVAASFLSKHLRIDWRNGERWFWDTLVDADPASNPASWQWVSGSGADAAPYFRIFNPMIQGEKFDPNGDYVRRWVPEIAALPDKYLHRPWEAPAPMLQKTGISLGSTYPSPIVDHATARAAALEAFKSLQQEAA